MPASWAEQVESNVAKVRKAQADALAEVTSLWTSAQEKQAAGAIRGFNGRIAEWASAGAAAAAANKEPGAGGWGGWVKAGQILADGFAEIAHIGKTAKLEAFSATVKAAPGKAAGDIARAAGKVSSAAAVIAGSVVRPFALPLVGVAVVLALAGGVYLWSRKA